jgi:hypothetical protein
MPKVEKFEGGQIPMGIRLPRGLYEELQDRAIASGVPIAEQFRRALRYWFDEHPVPGTKGGPARIKRTKYVSLKPSKSVAAKKGAKTR